MKIPKLFYFEEDAGGGHASAVDLMGPVDDGAAGHNEDTGAGEAATAPPPPPFDPNAFAAQFGDVVASKLSAAIPKPQAPQLTPEEAKKLLNVWDPDDAWFQQFGNIETQKQAVAAMRDGMLRHFDTVAQLRLREHVERIESQYAPVMQMVQQMQAQQQEQRFVSAYPQLTEPKLRPVLQAVAQSLQSEGFQPKSESEMFQAIASRVEAVMQVHNPTFKLTPVSAASSKPQPSGSIPVTTPGGGGGGGGGKSQGAESGKSRALSLLGPARPGR